MLAVEFSGCLLAWNNLPNEPTALFIFKDAGYPMDSLSPFTSSPNFLVKVTLARFLAGPRCSGRWGPTWQAGVGTWRQVSQNLSEFSMQTLKPQTTWWRRWRAVQASLTEPGVAGFVERHASHSRGAGARVRPVLPSGESAKCSGSRRAPAQVPANRSVCSMGTM